MAFFKLQATSSSAKSSITDGCNSDLIVHKRIKMDEMPVSDDLHSSVETTNEESGRGGHTAVHFTKSDTLRPQSSSKTKATPAQPIALDLPVTSRNNLKPAAAAEGLGRLRQILPKKKLVKSDVTSQEAPLCLDKTKPSGVSEPATDCVRPCGGVSAVNVEGAQSSTAFPIFATVAITNPATSILAAPSANNNFNHRRSPAYSQITNLDETRKARTDLNDAFVGSSYRVLPEPFSQNNFVNGATQQFNLPPVNNHHIACTTSTSSANNNNMDTCVDMDLPSPPNEESQHSGSRTPSGAGMDETFGEAPHPTPGPIQDAEMECADGDSYGLSSVAVQSSKSLLNNGMSSAIALVRDWPSNQSHLGSPSAMTLAGGHDGSGQPPRVLSHDSQWMLQYLQPFNLESCSSTCTADGSEYYMPDNVRTTLNALARMNDDDRSTLLDHLIWASPMRQLHHMKALLDPFFTRDFVGGLPRDVSLHILSYLEPNDLGRCARVSRLWRVICEDNLLWQVKCHESGYMNDVFADMRVPMRSHAGSTYAAMNARQRPSSVSDSHALPPDELGYLLTYRAVYGGGKLSSRNSNCGDASSVGQQLHNFSGNSQALSQHHGPPLPYSSTWKQTYRYHTQTDRNWRTGQHIYPLELYNHGRNFITSMVIAGERVLTGSEDTTVRVVELGHVSEIAAGKLTPREVRCHSNGVWALAADDGLCVSGGTDRTISVVDLVSGLQITQLRGHTSTVRCLALKNDICVSGSRDNSLRVWAARTGTCLFTLNGHGASVRCVCFDGTTIVSGSYDASVRVWNADDGKQRHELLGHTGRIYCLEFDGERIVSGCLNSLIVVWNAATGERVYELHGHNSLISALKLSGQTLISGGADSVVRVWNLNDRERDLPLYVGQGKHSSAITAIHIGRTYFVTSSDDGYVKLWDLRTGLFVRNLMKFDEAADMGVVWRIVATDNKLICACGHRARQTDSKVLLLDFDAREQIESDLFLKPSTTSATPPPVTNALSTLQQSVGGGAGASRVSPSFGMFGPTAGFGEGGPPLYYAPPRAGNYAPRNLFLTAPNNNNNNNANPNHQPYAQSRLDHFAARLPQRAFRQNMFYGYNNNDNNNNNFMEPGGGGVAARPASAAAAAAGSAIFPFGAGGSNMNRLFGSSNNNNGFNNNSNNNHMQTHAQLVARMPRATPLAQQPAQSVSIMAQVNVVEGQRHKNIIARDAAYRSGLETGNANQPTSNGSTSNGPDAAVGSSSTPFASSSVCFVDSVPLIMPPTSSAAVGSSSAAEMLRGSERAGNGAVFPRQPSSSLAPGAERQSS